jgi:hypothetical protein
MIPRLRFAALVSALSALAAAGPALTTIQDVLYKADGTRFNGSLTISWNSFQAADNSTIVTQSTTVKVVDGLLRVQLAPTTTASPQVNYSVTYTSDGRVQFQETWSVPSSGPPLRVRDVRLVSAATAPSGGAAGDTGTSPIAESAVVGLIADLGARPLKGPGFAAARAAIIDPTGMLASATGADSDCLHVDGSAGPCGSSNALAFIDGEPLTGIIDGSNTLFGLSAVPDPASSVAVYLNGLLQKVTQDFTLTGSTIQFVSGAAPQPGDTLLASYRTSGADAEEPQAFSTPQVLCSGAGGSTSSQTLANIGTCTVAAGVLQPGDRVEIRFDAAHTGSAAGFSVQVDWGATILAHRDAGAMDALVTGRGDAAILPAGAQLSAQSWGRLLPFAATVASSGDDHSAGITIAFQGLTVDAGDSVALSNFTVVRIP